MKSFYYESPEWIYELEYDGHVFKGRRMPNVKDNQDEEPFEFDYYARWMYDRYCPEPGYYEVSDSGPEDIPDKVLMRFVNEDNWYD